MFQLKRFDPRVDIADTDNSDNDEGDNVSASSSSVPSSSGSDESDTSSEEDEDSVSDMPRVAIIAPEQPQIGVALKKRRRDYLSDEAIDDLGVDDVTRDVKINSNIRNALKYSSMNIDEAARCWKLPEFLIKNLKEDNYQNFFPIQCLVIPDVIASERHSHLLQCRDVCVSAPTGSGKTLSFVLPVLNALSSRKVVRLRALVVLPSRDLAEQVFHVFERYARGSDLKVGLAIGQTDFESEQRSMLIGSREATTRKPEMDLMVHYLKPLDIDASLEVHSSFLHEHDLRINPLQKEGGVSAIDILVCTPGRLMDHLDQSPGFSLQHLRFLIIDEADRLLNQSYQNWISRVNIASNYKKDCSPLQSKLRKSPDGLSYELDPTTHREAVLRSIALESLTYSRPLSLRKMLFSATMTKDPQKLASLGLVYPKHFDVSEFKSIIDGDTMHDENGNKEERNVQKYIIPSTLDEFYVECKPQQKPLVLVALLRELRESHSFEKQQVIVVFTSSIESTHRLTRLLQLLWGSAGYGDTSEVSEYNSNLKQKYRQKILERCSQGEVSVLVCSDGMSRGMDLDVNAVIHYDVPSFAKTYVHRCGRTARAGKKGYAITILMPNQRKKFDKMRQLLIARTARQKGIKKDLIAEAIKVYPECTKLVKKVLHDENENIIDIHVPVREDYLV